MTVRDIPKLNGENAVYVQRFHDGIQAVHTYQKHEHYRQKAGCQRHNMPFYLF